MGQYWKPVNLDKHEYLHPHKLGAGLKLWEQIAAGEGSVGAALIVLTAAQRGGAKGGGDLAADEIIGRWAGDRIAIVGDYADDGDLAPEHGAGSIYARCSEPDDPPEDDAPKGPRFTDITDKVCALLERELGGKYTGDGWRRFKRTA